MNIEVQDSASSAKTKAGEKLASLLENGAPEPVLLMCSGGSALTILPETISPAAAKKLTIVVADERYSTHADANNFLQLSETEFYKQATAQGTQGIVTIPEKDEGLDQFAARVEQELIAWTTLNPTGKIVMTLGMGEDGHTAGIMPYPEDHTLFSVIFEDESIWVKGINVGEKSKFPERVTVTNYFLRHKVDTAVVYAVGEGKREVLKNVLNSKENIADAPARIWHHMKDVTVFTDIK